MLYKPIRFLHGLANVEILKGGPLGQALPSPLPSPNSCCYMLGISPFLPLALLRRLGF